MVWHDCKTDPPKKEGNYLLIYEYYDGCNWEVLFDRAYYSNGDWKVEDADNSWHNITEFGEEGTVSPIKWLEVDLSEVE